MVMKICWFVGRTRHQQVIYGPLARSPPAAPSGTQHFAMFTCWCTGTWCIFLPHHFKPGASLSNVCSLSALNHQGHRAGLLTGRVSILTKHATLRSEKRTNQHTNKTGRIDP